MSSWPSLVPRFISSFHVRESLGMRLHLAWLSLYVMFLTLRFLPDFYLTAMEPNPWLWDKLWEWPGNEVIMLLYRRSCRYFQMKTEDGHMTSQEKHRNPLSPGVLPLDMGLLCSSQETPFTFSSTWEGPNNEVMALAPRHSLIRSYLTAIISPTCWTSIMSSVCSAFTLSEFGRSLGT